MDISSAILDPKLGRSAFTVERLTYTRSATGTSSRSQTYSALGCIHPGTPEMIQLLPEEERHEEFIAIYTDFALSLGADHGSTYTGPDRIHWDGRIWRVVRVRDWAMFGYQLPLSFRPRIAKRSVWRNLPRSVTTYILRRCSHALCQSHCPRRRQRGPLVRVPGVL